MKFKILIRKIFIFFLTRFLKINPTKYWSIHRVNSRIFKSRKESLNHFEWRNSQYPGYIELMPVNIFDNKTVLDYGCGPGNDLVGFSEFSDVKKLIGVDVAEPSLKLAKKRLHHHKKNVCLIKIDENSVKIPLPNNCVDHIHSSGVLHHCKNLDLILEEFKRILKPSGQINIMVYNYYSIWVHLYTAYIHQIEKNNYDNLSLMDAFSRLTDGKHVPISKCYKPDDFISLMNNHGFEGKLNGVAISLSELIWLDKKNKALQNKSLKIEQRNFLLNLKFNDRGYPLYNNHVAGINACYNFKHSS
jgi:ubiquinone/menaquinone biosynthesis C-methylase UbiE